MKKILEFLKDCDILLLIICTAIVFLTNLIALEGFHLHEIISNRYIVIVILYILIFAMLKKNIKIEETINIRKKIFFIIIWSLFLFSILISKIVNKGSNIIDILLLLSFVPYFFFIRNSYNIEKHLNLACVINLLPLLLILKLGNTLGMLITIIGITVINITIRKITGKGYVFSYMFIVSFFTVLIAMTKSRTCLVSFLLVSGINYIYLLAKNKFYIKKIISIILIVICMIVAMGKMEELLFNKYGHTTKDITTGRGRIWKIVINDASLFGHQDDYFMTETNKGDAHNVYIQILGHYGIVSLILYLLLNVYIIIKVLKQDKKLEYMNFFLNYFIIGMFENILITDTKIVIYNVLLLVYIGKLLDKDKNKNQEQENTYEEIISHIYQKVKNLIPINKQNRIKEVK